MTSDVPGPCGFWTREVGVSFRPSSWEWAVGYADWELKGEVWSGRYKQSSCPHVDSIRALNLDEVIKEAREV